MQGVGETPQQCPIARLGCCWLCCDSSSRVFKGGRRGGGPDFQVLSKASCTWGQLLLLISASQSQGG